MIRSLFSRAAIVVSAVCFSLTFAFPASAAGWADVNSSAVFSDIAFSTDGQTGIAVGSGTNNVYRTTDGGKTWAQAGSNALAGEGLNAVSFAPNSNTAYVVGFNGVIGKTTDGGATVTPLSSGGVTSALYNVHTYDTFRAWAVGAGGKVLRTTDGGVNWIATTFPNENVNAVFFRSPDYGWAVTTSGKIYKTTNGAHPTVGSVVWTEIASGYSVLRDVYFKDLSIGYVIGTNGTLLRTINGGTNWSSKTLPSGVPAGTDLLSIHFKDATHGVIGGEAGVILHEKLGEWQNFSLVSSGANVGAVFLKEFDSSTGAPTDMFALASGVHRYDSVNPSIPTALAVTGGSPTTDSTPQFTWTASTDSETGIASYQTFVSQGNDFKSSGNPIGVSWESATLSPGDYVFSVSAMDKAGNESSSANITFTVTAPDTTPPTLGAITANPSSIVEDTPVTFSASVSSDTDNCIFEIDGNSQGNATITNNVVSKIHTFSDAGSYSVIFECEDAAGNEADESYTANVASSQTPPPPADTTVSTSMSSVSLSPTSIAADGVAAATVTVTVRNASNQVLSGKTVSLSTSLGGITITPSSASTNANGVVTFTVKATTQGTATLTATADGKVLDGKPVLTLTAPNQNPNPNPTPSCQNPVVAVGSLVKLPDDGNLETQSDSAVYYYGSDCKRHAFPNPKVYFTWYTDFNGVTVIDAAKLASMPLGKNVTYRPGIKMVKFTTDDKVYAVSKGGVLRWVKTEAAAIALYGTTWNKQIDDISDAFYINYVFSSLDISSASDYNRNAEMAAATIIDQSL